jgi:SAM-dependent methyltransferase
MGYLMSGQLSELERLEQGARMWEPAGQNLLDELGSGIGRRVVDIGCGSLGWLRLLGHWVGPSGTCVGTDFDERMLQAATDFVTKEELTNVELVKDDLFMSALPSQSFDLVHARFQLAPLGRFAEQLAAYIRLVRPGGMLVLEDPDSCSWHYQPAAPSTETLIELIKQAFSAGGGDFNAGRYGFDLLAEAGYEPHVRAEVIALTPGHPYLRLPLQFATSLRPRLLTITKAETLDALVAEATDELSDSARWGMSFTLVQTWAIVS